MREMFPPNRKSDKPIVVVSRGAKARKRQRRDVSERLKDMSRFASILLLLQLAVAPLSAQEFSGQVGRIDEAQLGLDWYRLRQGEFPILPVEGVRVSALDCEPACPDPVLSDPAGWFRFIDLASPVRLRFDPPECDPGDSECELLEPREVERESGARTTLGAKWPRGIVDTMLRYMPSVAGALYVKREGEIPVAPGAAGSASSEIVWVTGRHGWHPYLEQRTFLHEMMHLFEFRLRLNCWHENQDVDGYVMHENWLRAYDADRARLTSLGLPIREPEGYSLSGEKRGLETLAWFANYYFMPDALTLDWRKDHPSLQFMTHAELEQYAPQRYALFEKIVFGRYLKEKSWLGSASTGEKWPGMCRAPQNEWVSLSKYLLVPSLLPKRNLSPSAGFACGAVDLH